MYEDNNYLAHYGILGMKWGVRRYQNKDGSLTSAGKKRAQKDVDELSNAMSKHLDSTNDFQRSLKKRYLVDENGNNRYASDGKGYFDPRGGLTIYDNNKLTTKNQNERSYLDVKKLMESRYDSVKVDAKYDIQTGKASSKIILEKHGEQFVSEFSRDYGQFNTSKQVEFVPMYKR